MALQVCSKCYADMGSVGPDVAPVGADRDAWLRRDLSTGQQCAVKLFKRPVDPEVAHQLVQGINIQCDPDLGWLRGRQA